MFVVTFTTPAGQIDYRYNLFNQSAKAVEIAHGNSQHFAVQLAAIKLTLTMMAQFFAVLRLFGC